MDRDGPAGVRFRRRPLAPRSGETLLQALARAGLPTLQRSIRYHRPRAPFCGIGACTQCIVRVNGVPNTRACRYVPQPNDRIVTENAWPSPEHDVLGVLDSLFRHGLDTLHGFRRPAFATPLYHRVIRRLAGFGRLPDAPGRPAPPPSAPRDVGTLVVGGGVGGRAAARRLEERSASFLVVDRSTRVPPGLSTASGAWMADASVVFLPPPRPGSPVPFEAVLATGERAATLVRARNVIVAVGGYDGPLLFADNDRPGVVTADGLRALAPPGGAPPLRAALLVGGGESAGAVLDEFGSIVEAIAAPGPILPAVVERASALEIPLFPRTMLLRAHGRSRVRSVELQRRGGGPRFRHAVDGIILAHRRLPNVQLYFQAGATMEWNPSVGAYLPRLDATGATSVPGLFAAGESAGYATPASAEASGGQAADLALGSPPPVATPRPLPTGPPHELEGYYAELRSVADPGGKWILCPCEDVLRSEVEEAVRHGYGGIEVIKRITGVGTGLCQGRYCLPDALLWLAQLEGRPPSDEGYITQRPPVFTTPLGALADLPEEAGAAP